MSQQLRLLGTGPAATGGEGGGWAMSHDLLAKCSQCGYLMPLDPTTDDWCTCGALYKDSAAGRFGSTLGDASIEVYRRG